MRLRVGLRRKFLRRDGPKLNTHAALEKRWENDFLWSPALDDPEERDPHETQTPLSVSPSCGQHGCSQALALTHREGGMNRALREPSA